MSARGRLLLASLAFGAGACLEVKTGEPPMCKVDADCDAGEICAENICWGNPPARPLAAVVSPPSERTADLVSRELPALSITSDGWLDDTHLDAAVAFKGRLQCSGVACTGRATITVTRPSVIPGGPGFRRSFDVDDGSFELTVPATQPGDEPFTITVLPIDREEPGAGASLAGTVPPLQVQRDIRGSLANNLLELGGAGQPRVTGVLTTSSNTPLQGYRVVALGRWAEGQPASEVSTVDFTGVDGKFALRLSRGLVGSVELVARPYLPALRPELRLGSISATTDSLDRTLALPSPDTGVVTPVRITVDHLAAGGEIAPVAGARVIIAGIYGIDPNNSTRFTAEAYTSDNGVAELKLLDTPHLRPSYRLSIIPPALSKAAAVYAKPFDLLQPALAQRLGTRIAISGEVLAADGQPVKDVSVTARPSVRFLWSVDPAAQAFLGEIPPATAVTLENGKFVLFVDHALPLMAAGLASTVWGEYDLAFEPPATRSRVPSWTKPDVELPRDSAQDALVLAPLHLPEDAHVRGVILDDGNARVEGAEIRVYEVPTDRRVCDQVRFAPPDCPIPPLLVGRATSLEDGIVRLTLPR